MTKKVIIAEGALIVTAAVSAFTYAFNERDVKTTCSMRMLRHWQEAKAVEKLFATANTRLTTL